MDEATAKTLAEKAAAIAKETAETLKLFTRDTAMLLYAKQMVDNNMNMTPTFPEGTEHKKIDNKEANEKLNKMLEEAKQKWKYADEPSRKKAMQMEKIVLEGQEKIKAVYAAEVAKAPKMGR
jgi:hypothetical protein